MKKGAKLAYGVVLFFLFFLLVMLFSACSKTPVVTLHSHSSIHGKTMQAPTHSFFQSVLAPVELDNDEFHKAAGWLNNETIMYIMNTASGSSLCSLQLYTGEVKLLYKSVHPIISVELSPNRKMILVHSAVLNQGYVNIITPSGAERFSSKIDSHELSFQWNPFMENQILVTAFTADWEFSNYLLDVDQNSMKEIALPEPFARWLTGQKLVFQAWNENELSLVAPVRSIALNGTETNELFPSIIQFDTPGTNLLTVSLLEEDANQGQYTFYNKDLEQIGNFTTPLLTSFSGWLIPFYDLMNEERDFVYLRAIHTGEADVYKDGFDLMRYSLETQEEELIMSGLENEPLSCSPSGALCLYGFRFEKLLDTESKKITELVH